MTRRRQAQHDPLEAAIETALRPGQFIDYRTEWDFVSQLGGIRTQIDQLAPTDPARAVRLHETFLACCYEKAEEVDDSNGYFGQLVDGLYIGWLKARQAAGAEPDETASLLLDRMENDPYSFTYQIEREAVKVLHKKGLAAFERAVKTRFEAADGTEQARRGWGVIRTTIFVRQSSSLAIQSTAPGTSTQPKEARPLMASNCRQNGNGYNRTPISCAATSVSGSWWTPQA